jgi:branched-chain amino acid transport system ATP-binding protein
MPLLEISGLIKTFGAHRAVSGLNLRVKAGTLHSVIGPNGAGKTTLFNLITGELRPSAGRIVLQGADIGGLPPHVIPRLGIARAFQRNNAFLNMTVAENVWTAAFAHARARGAYWWRHVGSYAGAADTGRAALADVGLEALADRTVRELSHGDRRLLEVAIALATQPKLLLLDEPTSGLSPEESRRMMDLIGKLRARYTILLIEHKMDLVMRVSDLVTVMYFGAVLAEGTPAEVQANAEVRRAYLGTPRATAAAA